MDKNYTWFLKIDLKRYKGKYIAIAERKIVSSGYDPGKVYETAQNKYPHKKVVLWKVPPGDVFVFFI